MGKKTPPANRSRGSKRPSSSSGNLEDSPAGNFHQNPLTGDDRQDGRERSLSKKRKTSEQQKITTFTSSLDSREKQNEREGDTEIVDSHKDAHGNDIMTVLCRMERGMEEGKRQNERVNVQLEKIIAEMFEIRKENAFLRKKTETLEKKCNDLADDVSRLEKQTKLEKELRNSLEQYTRKDNFKIINLPGDAQRQTSEETEKQVLQFVQKTLNVPSFQPHVVSVAHRVGRFTPGQNRPVIVRLTTRKVLSDIFRQRKILKQQKSNIFINEDLTRLNSQRLAEIKRHPAALSAWSFHGKLYCKLLNLQIINIEDGDMDQIDRALLGASPSSERHQSQQSLFPGSAGGGRGRGRGVPRGTQDSGPNSRRPGQLCSEPPSPGSPPSQAWACSTQVSQATVEVPTRSLKVVTDVEHGASKKADGERDPLPSAVGDFLTSDRAGQSPVGNDPNE